MRMLGTVLWAAAFSLAWGALAQTCGGIFSQLGQHPTQPRTYYVMTRLVAPGKDFDSVAELLPELKTMGFTEIMISPVTSQTQTPDWIKTENGHCYLPNVARER